MHNHGLKNVQRTNLSARMMHQGVSENFHGGQETSTLENKAKQLDDDASADTAIKAVELWYSENYFYDYETEDLIPSKGSLFNVCMYDYTADSMCNS